MDRWEVAVLLSLLNLFTLRALLPLKRLLDRRKRPGPAKGR